MTKNNVMAIILSASVNCMTFSSCCWIFVSCIRYFEFCDLIVSSMAICFCLKTVLSYVMKICSALGFDYRENVMHRFLFIFTSCMSCLLFLA